MMIYASLIYIRLCCHTCLPHTSSCGCCYTSFHRLISQPGTIQVDFQGYVGGVARALNRVTMAVVVTPCVLGQIEVNNNTLCVWWVHTPPPNAQHC
jgi:hypothetical protein